MCVFVSFAALSLHAQTAGITEHFLFCLPNFKHQWSAPYYILLLSEHLTSLLYWGGTTQETACCKLYHCKECTTLTTRNLCSHKFRGLKMQENIWKSQIPPQTHVHSTVNANLIIRYKRNAHQTCIIPTCTCTHVNMSEEYVSHISISWSGFDIHSGAVAFRPFVMWSTISLPFVIEGPWHIMTVAKCKLLSNHFFTASNSYSISRHVNKKLVPSLVIKIEQQKKRMTVFLLDIFNAR